MERKELTETVEVNGSRYIVKGMVEFAPVSGSTQGVWQWDGRFTPAVMPIYISASDTEAAMIIAIEQFNKRHEEVETT